MAAWDCPEALALKGPNLAQSHNGLGRATHFRTAFSVKKPLFPRLRLGWAHLK